MLVWRTWKFSPNNSCICTDVNSFAYPAKEIFSSIQGLFIGLSWSYRKSYCFVKLHFIRCFAILDAENRVFGMNAGVLPWGSAPNPEIFRFWAPGTGKKTGGHVDRLCHKATSRCSGCFSALPYPPRCITSIPPLAVWGKAKSLLRSHLYETMGQSGRTLCQ